MGCYRWPEVGSLPDIIAVQEYDFHEAVAKYRDDCEETFANAMRASGFSYCFFKDPLRSRDPPSGVALFWRSEKYDISGLDTPSTEPHAITIACGEIAGKGAVINVDMEEHWHSLKAGSKVMMDEMDRRNAGLVHLVRLPVLWPSILSVVLISCPLPNHKALNHASRPLSTIRPRRYHIRPRKPSCRPNARAPPH